MVANVRATCEPHCTALLRHAIFQRWWRVVVTRMGWLVVSHYAL
jgi:hypothetical protein